MSFKNTKLQKFISGVLLLVLLAPSVFIISTPRKTEAQFTDFVNAALNGLQSAFGGTTAVTGTANLAVTLKNVAKEIGKQILMSIAKKALAEMTKSTVNWINSGFHGAPLFLENPSAFFKDIGKFQIKDFVQVTGYDNLKYPFGKQYALDVIAAYKRQFADNAAYSLSNVTNDPVALNNLRIDFQSGGWNAFLINTQYPQNNPIGYRTIASRELSTRLDGVFKSPAEKVNDTLQQGLGFLSPETCPDNPAYNNGYNEFNKPDFKFTPPANLTEPNPNNYTMGADDPDFQADYDKYNQQYGYAYRTAKNLWAISNDCPGGLKKTTPGSVIGSQITKSLGTTQTQKELAAALGNGIGAIFDSLINKFLSKGLNALSSKINNSSATNDDFSYYGQTLGSPVDSGLTDDWSVGPDEEIILDDFKRDVSGGIVDDIDDNGVKIGTKRIPGGIELIQQELDIINFPSVLTTQLGIIQTMDLNWRKVKELDECQPGPDKGWEKRLKAEEDANSTIIQEQSQDYASQAKGSLRGLKFAVASFKDWINEKMELALPGSILYIDAIKNIDAKFQRMADMGEKAKTLRQTLARLKVIERNLSGILTQPAPGSPEEKNLIAIKKAYNAIKENISSSATIEASRAILDTEQDSLQSTLKLTSQCLQERSAAGYTGAMNKGGNIPTTVGKNGAVPEFNVLPGKTFQQIIAVIVDGDGNRKNTTNRVSWDIPFANSKNNNKLVWAPIVTPVPGMKGSYPNPIQAPIVSSKEIDQYCELPIIGGYSHTPLSGDDTGILSSETSTTDPSTGNVTTVSQNADGSTTTTVYDSNGNIVSGPTTTPANGSVTPGDYLFHAMTNPVLYPNLPVVNALHLFHHVPDQSKNTLWHWANIAINCNVVYAADVLDYKKAGDDAF